MYLGRLPPGRAVSVNLVGRDLRITSSRGVQGEEDERNDGQCELNGEQRDGHFAVVASLLRES